MSNFDLTKIGKYDIILSTFNGLTNLKYLNLLNFEIGSILDLSNTYLGDIANLTICKNRGIKTFSNETSKIFRCCETPFNTSKCNNNYIQVEYRNFTGNLTGFISGNTILKKVVYSPAPSILAESINSPGTLLIMYVLNIITYIVCTLSGKINNRILSFMW